MERIRRLLIRRVLSATLAARTPTPVGVRYPLASHPAINSVNTFSLRSFQYTFMPGRLHEDQTSRDPPL